MSITGYTRTRTELQCVPFFREPPICYSDLNFSPFSRLNRVAEWRPVLTVVCGDVVAAVGRLQPAGHLPQDHDLPPDHCIGLGDVHFHIRVRHLIGQSAVCEVRFVSEEEENKS